MKIAFIDIETTGLDPRIADLVEVGIIVDDYEFEYFNANVDTAHASIDAMRINRYYERYDDAKKAMQPRAMAQSIARLTSGCVLAGANVHFDKHFLEDWMTEVGFVPAWDYHVLDVPTYAAAYLNTIASLNPHQEVKPIVPPYRMNNELLRRLGLTRDEAAKHTALGDARTAKMVWDYVSAAAP